LSHKTPLQQHFDSEYSNQFETTT